ncbi:MAG: ShlB/FhaC/HecB family hemolysin secretion/activation protein [Gammaproteobacteria bacterium]
MKGLTNVFSRYLIVSLFLFFIQQASAITITNVPNLGGLLPGSTEPGVIGKNLSAPPITAPLMHRAPSVKQPEKTGGGLGPEAAKVKFKLNKIILEGNKVYSERQLRMLYKDKIGKTISVADLEGIVQSITNFYRNNGFILSRAILPPQHVANGVVHIRILEGYIAAVHVQGDPKKAAYLLQAYGNRIAADRPLEISVMEYYLRLANEIPGMTARAVLEPSKTEVAASDMSIVANEKTWGGYLSYDNYGTRYIGPNQVTANISGNSVFQSGDNTQITTVRTSRPQQLKYFDINHTAVLGTHGMRGQFGANRSQTLPGLNLAKLKIDGDAVNFYLLLTYPLIRSRDSDLTLDAGANYIDSAVDTFNHVLYNDHLRSIKFGGNYNLSDRFYGSNLFALHCEQGLPIWGASHSPNSRTTSRFGADGIYTKFYANAGRLQQLFWKFSTFIYTTGQFSFNPLLATPQFAYGGSQLGRGYDPAEIIGDRGAAGSIELRLDFAPGLRFLQSIEPYAFYDAGVIWNIKNVPGTKRKQSCTSTGIGTRIVFNKYLSGNVMFAQPLTKQVTAEAVIGQGRLPRSFFSIVGSV